jgi:DNA-binding PadR family transcriptional regulator
MIRNANKRKGYQLTEHGRLLTERFMSWFNEVEEIAVARAREVFGWQVRRFDGGVID